MGGQMIRKQRLVRFTVESLEDRAVPATFGVPWDDPSHLSLSFAPDGTALAGHTSTLFQTLNAQMPTAQWQREILRAFQTWAVNANVNIALVADNGQAFGIAGKSQHDGRFGDIRVGAQPMGPESLSISVPNDPGVSSTLTGDVFINTSDKFSAKSLEVFSVLLHEAGHVFGIDDGTDPKSPMYPNYLGNSKLTQGDIASLRSLYGTRALDPHEGSNGNNTIATATTIQAPGSYTGATPLVIYGDIASNNDADVYAFRAPSGYKGSATIRVQSAGISLLAPHFTIVDAHGHVLADAQAASDFGDVVSVTLPAVDPNATYYLKVQGATSDVFGIGSFGVAVSFDAKSNITPNAIDAVLRGPYQTLSPNDIDSLFLGTANPLFNNTYGSDDLPGTATVLSSLPGYARNAHYEGIGSIASPSDVNFYRIQTADAPAGGKPLVLTVTTRAMSVNGTAPRVMILDRDGNAVSTQILANGNGMFTVQAVGVKAGGWYLLKVGPAPASGSAALGNYSFSAQFGIAAAGYSTFASGTLASPAVSQSNHLYVGESQLMHMVLTADAGATSAPTDSAVRMTVLDSTGNVVYALTAMAGDTVSGPDLFLAPGSYTIYFTTIGTANLLPYRLIGASISDPIGPVLTDPTLAPIYSDPTMPGWFLYPSGPPTTSPFIIVPMLTA